MKSDIYPNVVLIVAAYNEEKVIEKKIMNSFEIDYPEENFKIIIVADGSTDSTYDIVKKYEGSRLMGLHQQPRRGKTAALNRALKKAEDEIVVFSDANSMYASDAVKILVRNFFDQSVGGACGRKRIMTNDSRESSRGDSLFWDFESRLKTMQSHVGSISTGDGEIFAIRRLLYKEVPDFVINDDTAITLNIIEQGYRVIYEPEAVSQEKASTVIEDDFNVKARMVSGGYQTLKLYSRMFFPPQNFFSFQFISHKMLRWLMPILLIGLFFISLLIGKGIYIGFWFLQLLFYLSALAGYIFLKKGHKIGFLYYPLYYCWMNAAAVLGLIYFLKKDNVAQIWKKAKR